MATDVAGIKDEIVATLTPAVEVKGPDPAVWGPAPSEAGEPERVDRWELTEWAAALTNYERHRVETPTD